MVLKKVGVTGASGMIGRHVLAELQRRGISYVATSRRKPFTVSPNASWFKWDITHWKSLEELDMLFPDIQALFHLAAIIPQSPVDANEQIMFDTNIRACLCLGQWALKRDIPLVYLSSSTVYTNQEKTGIKEDNPVSLRGVGGFYGFSKLIGEQVLEFLSGERLKVCILRPSSLYGNGLPQDKMIPNFLLRASRDETIELAPPLDDKIDLIHADDVVHGMLLALEHDAWGMYNIGSEKLYSIVDIVAECIKTVGGGKIHLPSNTVPGKGKVRFALDCLAAHQAFGYEPQIDLREGLKRTWAGMMSSTMMTSGS